MCAGPRYARPLLAALCERESMSNSQEIKEILKKLSVEIEIDSWKEYFSKLYSRFETDFEAENLDGKFKYMRGLESLNGGMGSLNDAFHPNNVQEKINRLYGLVNEELIKLWAALGNETHDLKSIQPYKVGTIVKFVAGKVRYINRDGSIKYVPDQKWVREQEWKIEYIASPDITNMLQYSLVQGSKHALVRHDALQPVKRSFFSNVRKLFT